ncbi:hypothetical protein SAMN04488123_10627, partial [Natribacillus halophilus]
AYPLLFWGMISAISYLAGLPVPLLGDDFGDFGKRHLSEGDELHEWFHSTQMTPFDSRSATRMVSPNWPPPPLRYNNTIISAIPQIYRRSHPDPPAHANKNTPAGRLRLVSLNRYADNDAPRHDVSPHRHHHRESIVLFSPPLAGRARAISHKNGFGYRDESF